MSPVRLFKNKFLVVGLLVFFNLIIISYQVPLGSRPSLLERFLLLFFARIQRTATAVYQVMASGWQNLKALEEVKRENLTLIKENFFLRQENILLQEKLRLTHDRLELEEGLKLISTSIIPARIIGFDTSNFYRSAVINRGIEDGVVKNLPVCDKFGNLVGRTAEPVLARESRVILITSEESGVAVISASEKMPGILSGDGQGRCLVKYVLATFPRGQEGEEIITSGYDQIFPPGLKVGRIVRIFSEGGVFKKILVHPYFNFRELSMVAVLKNTDTWLR